MCRRAAVLAYFRSDTFWGRPVTSLELGPCHGVLSRPCFEEFVNWNSSASLAKFVTPWRVLGIFKRGEDGLVMKSEPQHLEVLSVTFEGRAGPRWCLRRPVLIFTAHVSPGPTLGTQHVRMDTC